MSMIHTRCMFVDDSGDVIKRCAPHCKFAHPGDRNWDTAPRRQIARKSSFAARPQTADDWIKPPTRKASFSSSSRERDTNGASGSGWSSAGSSARAPVPAASASTTVNASSGAWGSNNDTWAAGGGDGWGSSGWGTTQPTWDVTQTAWGGASASTDDAMDIDPAPQKSSSSTSAWSQQPAASASSAPPPDPWASSDSMRVDTPPPRPSVDKGKGRAVEPSVPPPPLPRRRTSSASMHPPASPVIPREREMSHVSQTTSSSYVSEQSSAPSSIPTDPEEIHQKSIKTFLRILQLTSERNRAAQEVEKFKDETQYSSIQMVLGVEDSFMENQATELAEKVDRLDRKISNKQHILHSELPDVSTEVISVESFNANAETVSSFLVSIEGWLTKIEQAEKDARVARLARQNNVNPADPLPPLLLKKWPVNPSPTFIQRRLRELAEYVKQLEQFFEEERSRDDGKEMFDRAMNISDKFASLRVDVEPPSHDDDPLVKELERLSAARDEVQEEVRKVQKTMDVARETLKKAEMDRDNVKLMKAEAVKRIEIMEEAGRKRRAAIDQLSEQIRNLHLLRDRPPMHLMKPLLEELADKEMQKIMPLVGNLESTFLAATKESADRVAANIDQYISPAVAKVKSYRVRAHSLGYNGK